jgi:hypothetical protein
MIQQTKVATLVVLSVLASAIGWSLSQLWPMWFEQGIPISVGSAVAMVLVALSLLVWTLMTRARLKPGSQAPRLHPLVRPERQHWQCQHLEWAHYFSGSILESYYQALPQQIHQQQVIELSFR